jgi:hypothetical protein
MNERRLPETERAAHLVRLWNDRGRGRRTRADVVRFYSWLAEHAPALIPAGPGAFQQLQAVLQSHVIDEPGADSSVATDESWWVITDRSGAILAVSEALARVLGGEASHSFLWRDFLLFIEAPRSVWRLRTARATPTVEQHPAHLLTRDDGRLKVVVSFRAMSSDAAADIRWTLQRL